jgi:hypothetical protein
MQLYRLAKKISVLLFGRAEVAKSVNPPITDIQSTPDLARKYNPVEPTPTTTPK